MKHQYIKPWQFNSATCYVCQEGFANAVPEPAADRERVVQLKVTEYDVARSPDFEWGGTIEVDMKATKAGTEREWVHRACFDKVRDALRKLVKGAS